MLIPIRFPNAQCVARSFKSRDVSAFVSSVGDNKYNIDYRFGSENRSRTDMLNAQHPVTECRSDSSGLFLEQNRPHRIVIDNGDVAVHYVGQSDCDLPKLVFRHVTIPV